MIYYLLYLIFSKFSLYLSRPSITDWIQASASFIGIPAAIIGLYKLFQKDKEREAEISSLIDTVKELKKHTEKLDERNQLLRHEIKVMNRINKVNHRPSFSIGKYSLYNSNFTLQLNNLGGIAKIIRLENDSIYEIEHLDLLIDKEVLKSASITIKGSFVAYKNSKSKLKDFVGKIVELDMLPIPFGVTWLVIEFEDSFFNRYTQKVTIINDNNTPIFRISDPIDLSPDNSEII